MPSHKLIREVPALNNLNLDTDTDREEMGVKAHPGQRRHMELFPLHINLVRSRNQEQRCNAKVCGGKKWVLRSCLQ